MPKVTIIRDEDWMGMYVDGILRAEGHVVTPEMAALVLGADLELVGVDHRKISRILDEHGSCPGTLADLRAGTWNPPTNKVLIP